MNKLLTLPRSSRSAAPPIRTRMNFEVARTQMLGQQLRAWEVLDDRVLRAFAETPREDFVPREYRDLAFADTEIPLGHGQAMLAPKVEGRILQALQVEPIDDVLVVGTGSGYLTACLARLAKRVTSVDIFPDFATAAPKMADARHSQRRDQDGRRAELVLPRTVRRDRRHGLGTDARRPLHRDAAPAGPALHRRWTRTSHGGSTDHATAERHDDDRQPVRDGACRR